MTIKFLGLTLHRRSRVLPEPYLHVLADFNRVETLTTEDYAVYQKRLEEARAAALAEDRVN